MAMQLRCGDLMQGCTEEMQGETEDEVMGKAAAHARDAHGILELDEATLNAVRGAIRPGI